MHKIRFYSKYTNRFLLLAILIFFSLFLYKAKDLGNGSHFFIRMNDHEETNMMKFDFQQLNSTIPIRQDQLFEMLQNRDNETRLIEGKDLGNGPEETNIMKFYFQQLNSTIPIKQDQLLEMLQNRDNGTRLIEGGASNNITNICDECGNCKPIAACHIWRAEEFTSHINRHLRKDRVSPTLRSFTEISKRFNPKQYVKDTAKSVEFELVNQELDKDKKRRLELGDTDLTKIPEIIEVLKQEPNKIPNIVHSIWFGCSRFKIHHYLNSISILRYQKPTLLLFHTNCVPNGVYWNSFVEKAGNTLMILRRSPPLQIYGIPIKVIEHQADVARLQIILEVGGIYLDGDFIVLKSMDDLRSNKIVLGESLPDGVGNGIILAQSNSWFLKKWYNEYKHFKDSKWGDSSVHLPWALWRLFPTTVEVVQEKMIRPNLDEVKYIFQELWDWKKSYVLHLYARFMKREDGTEERTIQELAVLNTTYGEIARHALWGDYHIINSTEIIITWER